MKKLLIILILISLLCGCAPAAQPAQIAATTLPVYEFTARLCEGTGITVTRLVTENVSCLHDYTLQVSQMRTVESADVVILSGAGLEAFLEEALEGAAAVIDSSEGIALLCPEEDHHHEEHDHHHESDPHIWLSPANAALMAQNICDGLVALYPEHTDTLRANLAVLLTQIAALDDYGRTQLAELSHREIITFHDGFSYLAQHYDLHILRAVEEESGSEASAAELIELIELVKQHQLTTIFTEVSGTDSAARIIAAETGTCIRELDMAMSGSSYFDAMYRNIDALKEALE